MWGQMGEVSEGATLLVLCPVFEELYRERDRQRSGQYESEGESSGNRKNTRTVAGSANWPCLIWIGT